MNWSRGEVDRAVEAVGKKASIDGKFRELCLESPEEAIKKVTGKEIPRGYKIRIVENSPGYDQTFVLPDLIRSELSDDELDRVAGGRGCDSDCGGQCGRDCQCPGKNYN